MSINDIYPLLGIGLFIIGFREDLDGIEGSNT
jgi:hypothetical protein